MRVSQFLVLYVCYRRGGFMLPSEIGTFSNTHCVLIGKVEVLAVLFSSITRDCRVSLSYFLARAPADSLALCGSLDKSGGPRGPRSQACI